MKIKLNGWIDEASGSYGDTVFREKAGQTIVSRKPRKKKTPPSESQVIVQKRFRQAADYADYVTLNPALLPLYEAAARKAETSVYMLCRKDWYKAPEIDAIRLEKYKGQVGDVIRLTVHDEIGAETVIMTLYDDDTGDLIEQGEAVVEFEGTGHWMYTATKQVQAGVTVGVRAEAFDHPGNVGQQGGIKKILAL